MEYLIKEKNSTLNRMQQLQKEVVDLQSGGGGGIGPGGPYLHAIKRVGELKNLPAGVLKTLEWQLRKDLIEVEKVGESY